jgi:uncharacterized protein YdhG (YjbR/CyaY superfamily)
MRGDRRAGIRGRSRAGRGGGQAMKNTAPKNIDEYLGRYPKEIQTILQKIRIAIRKAAPSAKETISYQMPAFRQGGVLVYFAAFSDHISFFPTSSGVRKFQKELGKYETSKGTIKFPLDKPIPYGLISKITKFRVGEISEEK